MSHRVIKGLRWSRPCARPSCIPQSRPRGAKGKGLTYERKLAKRLTELNHGQWFEFEDSNGHGYCQTDFIAASQGVLYVLECKYTWVIQGHLQIEQLYLPVLQAAQALPVFGFVVCKNLTSQMPKLQIAASIGEAQELAQVGRTVWHWLG